MTPKLPKITNRYDPNFKLPFIGTTPPPGWRLLSYTVVDEKDLGLFLNTSAPWVPMGIISVRNGAVMVGKYANDNESTLTIGERVRVYAESVWRYLDARPFDLLEGTIVGYYTNAGYHELLYQVEINGKIVLLDKVDVVLVDNEGKENGNERLLF